MNAGHNSRVWTAALDLARRVGMAVSPTTKHTAAGRNWDTPWDGAVLHGHRGHSGAWSTAVEPATSWPVADADLFHDIAHWLSAEGPAQRLVGFGMGHSYDGAGDWQSKDPWFKSSTAQEHEVSALGILLHSSTDEFGAKMHAVSHEWDPLYQERQLVSTWLQPSGGNLRAEARLLAAGLRLEGWGVLNQVPPTGEE